MEILSQIFYFVITIGVLVFIHEMGHFLAAKFFKMRVDRFSIGFPPRAFGKQIGETDYCISWIPIGGYVKITGMVDESLDTEFLNQPPQPWEFRAKPIWQRMIVISAGVVMNILLAVAIFWGIIYSKGKDVRPITEISFVTEESPAAKAGFLPGDKILSINDRPVQYWEDVDTYIYAVTLGSDLNVRVQRNGTEHTLSLARDDIPDISEERFGIFPEGLLAVVTAVEAGKPAEQLGLQPGDIITALNDTAVSYHEVPVTIKKYTGTEFVLRWKRDDEERSGKVVPNEDGRIGISLGATYTGPVEHLEYTLFEAFPAGVADVVEMSGLFFTNIFHMFTGKVSFSKSVGGPIKIAQFATRSAEVGLVSFLGFMALLSISLALINILPFPALDGGHLMFLIYEAVFHREIPNKIKIALQQAGFFLLLVFMAFVMYNDIVN
ncbi:MAG: RIP metalloprotease RseP [Ignavibacteriae bacterium]|nr:RIP metalloprotease RseP [Ignavibacteriota bacterium]